MLAEVRRIFRPEFLNRIDEIIVFHELGKEHLSKIIDLMIRDLQFRLYKYDLTLELTEEAKEWLAEAGYNPVYGARPLRRAIEQYVENPLANKLLHNEFKDGDRVIVDRGAEGLTFSSAKPAGKTRKKRAVKEKKDKVG